MPRIRVLTDGGGGMVAQALGLAQKIAALGGGEVLQNTVALPSFAALLPPSFAAALQSPKISGAPMTKISTTEKTTAEIIIGCGIKAQAATLMLKKQRGAFAVCIQRPCGDEKLFDAVVAPRHDYTDDEICAIENNSQTNTILTLGAVGAVDAHMLATRRDVARRQFARFRPPFIAALLGGENRAYLPQAAQLIAQLKAVAVAADASLLITPSPRTDIGICRALHEAFGETHYIWDGSGENPYLNIIAAADGFCVTIDSVNMISEACAAGCSVYLLPLSPKPGWRARRGGRKFARFHAEVISQQRARFWDGDWTQFAALPGLNETARAADWVWRQYCAWR